MTGRLGVLGGTFDPPHLGHLVVAQDVVEELELDRLVVIPAGDPPHRGAVFPARLRLELVRESFRGDDRIEVSDLEVERDGPSFTVDTLERLRAERSPDELFCVIGVDQLRELHEWREPGRIARLARLVVMSRGGDAPGPGDARADVDFEAVDVTRVDLSSTRIRERLAAGRPVRYLVPERIRARVEAAWAGLAEG